MKILMTKWGSVRTRNGLSLLKSSFIALGLLVFLAPYISQTAFAVNFPVTKILDTNDGICDADCSLREAIGAANSLAGPDVIVLPAGTYTLSIAGTGEDANTTGDLDITGNLTITGAGKNVTIINGGSIDRVLEVRPLATVQIDAVTIQNGNPGTSAGGILNRNTLKLMNSIVADNTGVDFGGGIFNLGTMTMVNTTVNDNDTVGFNFSGGGGGIFNQGTLTMTGTTMSGNTTLGRGGAIYNLDLPLNMVNGTISGNTGLNGGGIFNRFGTVQLVSSTIANNTATDNGGGIWNFGGSMTLRNTIVSGNMAATASDDCAGVITSLGHNLASDASCALGGTGDFNSTNPVLGPLADNGGPTFTHALLTGSPAIDSVPVASCTVSTDQRGVARPQGPACDIGAFEVESIPPCNGKVATIYVDPTGNILGGPLIVGGPFSGLPYTGNLMGTLGDDVIVATNGPDQVLGLGGNDTICTFDSPDSVTTLNGMDFIDAGEGNNIVVSGGGKDFVKAGSSADLINCGFGADTASPGGGTNSLTSCETVLP